jgi:hypothetical protein
MTARKALIRLALRAIHLLPQAGEVKEYSPLPLAGGEARSAGEGQSYSCVMALPQGGGSVAT